MELPRPVGNGWAFVIGNWKIKNVNWRDVSCNNSTKIRSHPGAAADNFIDYVQPSVCQMPNLVIIYTGRNDFQNNINTIQKLRNVISTIKEYDTDNYIEIALFSILYQIAIISKITLLRLTES